MKLTVIRNGLHLKNGEARVGQIIEVPGDTIPTLYRGKVRVADESIAPRVLEVATPDEPKPSDEKSALIDEIEELTGKRPNGNTSIEKLKSQLAELKG